VGALGSAASPTFVAIALAQVAVGLGLALVLSAGVAAAAEWVPAGHRARTLSWALLGQPAAWVVGQPLVGLVASADWRFAFLAVPFAGSALAMLATWTRRRDPPAASARLRFVTLLRSPRLTGWAAGELLAYAAWSGTLLYSGTLFVDSYGMSVESVGLVLGVGAAAYFPGNFLFRRWVDAYSRRLLVVLALALATAVALLGLVRPGAGVSLGIFSVVAFLAAGRTIAGSALGLDLAPDAKVATTSVRTTALQFGYLLGAALGGAALALGGLGALGVMLAALFALAAVPHILALVETR
jgi:MFS transporter, DHA1 family, inner membrane transport protein